MGILSMSALIQELQSGVVPKHKKYIFKFFSPIVFIANSAFFAAVIFGHRAINYLITSFVGEIDVQINFYHTWAYGVVAATGLLMILGVIGCYWVNTVYGDGKNFWDRIIAIGFIVRCHMLLYALIGVVLIGIFSNLHFTKEIGAFTQTIYPELTKPPASYKAQKAGRAFVVHAFRSPGAIGFLPLVPSKFKFFFTQLCKVLLMLYQLLSVLPLFLVIFHYLIVAWVIKKHFGIKKSA